MTMLPTFLAGANFVMHSAGWLEGGLVAGFEKFVIDVELVADAPARVHPAGDRRGVAGLRRARGGRPRRPLPRRDAHDGALPDLLLPPDALVVGELRALDAQRRQGHRRPGRRTSTRRSSTSTSSRPSTTRSARSSRSTSYAGGRSSATDVGGDLRRSPIGAAVSAPGQSRARRRDSGSSTLTRYAARGSLAEPELAAVALPAGVDGVRRQRRRRVGRRC